MPVKGQQPYPSSPLGKILKEYRVKYDLTQEALASELDIDVRTLRRYEKGETPLTDVLELRRIAGILGIEPERLGVLPGLSTDQEVDEATHRIWTLARQARFYEAQVMVDRLIEAVTHMAHTDDPLFLRRIALARHVAGYISGQMARADNVSAPLLHYHAMEELARQIGDASLLNIALSYQGDMLQRTGQVDKAIAYLEAARDTTPDAAIAARGNGIQLLGRAYFKAERLADFERTMHEAESLAYEPHADEPTSIVRGQFGAGTVYEEWGRSLGLLRQTQKAMNYLGKAEQAFAQNWTVQRRDMLMMTAKAMVLVHGGDIEAGVPVALEAVHLCRKYGNMRLLDRVYGLQQYLDRLSRQIGHAGGELRDALYGTVEY